MEKEFDMTTNEGRLAYAIKYYPIGTVIKSMFSGKTLKLTSEPIIYTKFNGSMLANAGPEEAPDIYYNGKWAEIIDKVKE